ncbi:chlororespiratory reduction protein 7 [Merismopedia glauca]|uniref:Chlororespiratory reduction protein 7 n=1 Tax=Merismopedia glauca CCAP 1448/3 TaxID=1296344 RepID=A0A2T1C7Y7_9CYAN|nr:chlororespiratory reduction protein 7 [Merismopedia glauca]PSB04371.1 chlororespiratory reduction protein 7 [Merismopedia glauca CCAP 1448/3]
MSDSLMYRDDAYVVLEPNQAEQFLSPTELLTKLQAVLAGYNGQLSPDFQRFDSIEAKARYLMETACEFNAEPGKYLQWYVVRLEK